MRTIDVVAVAAIVAALSASARADGYDTSVVRPAERPDFAGGYIGLNAGSAWGSSDYATDPGCPPVAVAAPFCNTGDPSIANGQAVAASGSGDLAATGFTGGIQGGYNWQYGKVVFGGEGDLGAFDLDKSSNTAGVFPFVFAGTRYALSESMSTDWLITLRGRLGYTVARHLLLYGTAGLALTDFKFSSSYSDNANNGIVTGGTGAASVSNVMTGWTIGGGGEWLVDSRWSIKAEYLYIDFGSTDFPLVVTNSPAFVQTMTIDADLSAQLARIGINYRP